jgi:hypothetical protein
MSGPYSGPYDASSSSRPADGFVTFLMVLTESAASAAGAAAAAIAAAQEVGQQRAAGVAQQQQEGPGEGLNLQLPPQGMVAFYQSYQRYVETAALPSWWLRVSAPGRLYTQLLHYSTHSYCTTVAVIGHTVYA